MVTGMGMLTGMTSRPIPSPGINPIRSDLEAMGEFGALESANVTYLGFWEIKSRQRQASLRPVQNLCKSGDCTVY